MQLYHHPFCPLSRYIRASMLEYGIEPTLIVEDIFARREDFLKLNPAGLLPVLVEQDVIALSGSFTLTDYLEQMLEGGERLMPTHALARAEVMRLLEWFNIQFYAEVSRPFKFEMIDKRFLTPELGGGAPDMSILRQSRTHLKGHLRYIGWLVSQRRWLAGDTLSYADFAAGAHLSVFDYFGDIDWHSSSSLEDENAKIWYARLKSRPSFRALLTDRVIGMSPSLHYTDPDF